MSFKGIKQSQEHIQKRVESKAGFQHSEETKKVLAEKAQGRTNSPETRAKISAANRGQKLSELSKLDGIRDMRPGYRGFLAANTIDDIRHKAKKRGKEWSIDSVEAYKMIIAPCRYCGFAPNWPESHIGIDRVDNSKGYVAGNCVPCCFTCNSAKKELSEKEFFEWVKRISNHLNKEII